MDLRSSEMQLDSEIRNRIVLVDAVENFYKCIKIVLLSFGFIKDPECNNALCSDINQYYYNQPDVCIVCNETPRTMLFEDQLLNLTY